ncbi:MAG: TetR/AcrR family transcriptional regulator [Acetobacteraceae bacterium]|nr:TetR/AcrR family transcriptional regulator [Acetobacteraceae bacterium]
MKALQTDTSSYSIPPALTKRSQQKRALILSAAIRYFAQHGYEAARVGDIAAELGIAKGSVFQHFGSKDGLFLEAYKESVSKLPGYLEAPDDVRSQGFWAVLRHRLENAGRLREHHQVHYEVMLLGNYGSDMNIKKRIARYLSQEDPLGLKAFVRLGLERGELRRDVDPDLIASIVESTVERFQDSLTMSESHPDLFHGSNNGHAKAHSQRIEEFILVLRGAIGAGQAAKAS